MEFKNSETIKNCNYYIHIGNVNNELAIILADFHIYDFDKILKNSKLLSKVGNCWTMENKKPFNLYYPCNKDCFDENISKYIIINESKDEYNLKIKPYIEKIYFENTRWIYNIFDKKTEQENVIFRNDDFIICKDITWTDTNPINFYILGFPFKNLKSIRDLRQIDITLLKNMKKEMIKYANKYKLKEEHLYFFFHYHPSFYHLHLHCAIINNKELSIKYNRYHMVDNVINNLHKDTNYYANSTITFEIPDYHIINKLCKL